LIDYGNIKIVEFDIRWSYIYWFWYERCLECGYTYMYMVISIELLDW